MYDWLIKQVEVQLGRLNKISVKCKKKTSKCRFNTLKNYQEDNVLD